MGSLTMTLFDTFQASVLCLAFSTLWTAPVIDAQAVKPYLLDPVKNFCSRWWSQSIVKNDILYIDSGVQKWNGTDVPSPIFGINSYMITIPLNSTWDWKTNIAIETQAKNATNPKTGTLPPSQIRGHMFHGPAGKPEVYLYGGTTYLGNQSFEAFSWADSSAYPLWSYTYGPQYPWNQFSTSTAWMPNNGAGAEAIDQGLAFYLNGQIDRGTSAKARDWYKSEKIYVPLSGMVVLDLNKQSAKNISTANLRGGVPRIGGTMEYIESIGNKGALVALGGQVQSSPAWAPANHTEGSLIDFTTVDVFDIDSYLRNPAGNGTWYSQKTTGDIPEPRIDFCTVIMSAPDNSSHHIYLYGGKDPMTGKSYDDVLILTMPSFTWTNVWPNGGSPRWGHNCHVAGKRQMITVGGNITNGGACDWELKGVAVWEMTTLTWGSVFMTNLTDYQVPQKVLEFTGGTVTGGASIKEPSLGWTDQGLKSIFETSRKGANGNSTTGADPNAPTDTSKSRNNTAAIAGGVVGGIVGLTLLVTAIFLLRRYRSKKHAPHELPDSPSQKTAQLELSGKGIHEVSAMNENNPAELVAPELQELETPWQPLEADHDSSVVRAELPGTNPGTFKADGEGRYEGVPQEGRRS